MEGSGPPVGGPFPDRAVLLGAVLAGGQRRRRMVASTITRSTRANR
jgi:hypothetical protein